MYRHRRCWKWLPPASIRSCARLTMSRCTRCNIVIMVAATAWLMLSFRSCMVCGFDSYTVLFKCPQRKFPPPRLGGGSGEFMLHRLYLNMVTARLLTNCSNTLRNMHTNAREHTTRTRAKRKADYFFVAHSVLSTEIWFVFRRLRKIAKSDY